MMKGSLNKLIRYSWINSMLFSSPVVKSSDPLPEVHGSSFVSCARLSISDIEMGWVDVDEPSSTSATELPTTSQFPTRSNYQFDRTLSSSSSFRVSFTMDEMDFVIVETFPTPPLNHMNASRFVSSSSFSSTRSSIPPSQSSNLGWVAVEEPSSTSETELPTTSQFPTRSSSFPTPLNHMNASRSFASSSSFSSTRSSPPPSQSSNLVNIPSPSSSLVPSPSIVRSSPPSSSSALPQDHNSFSSRNSVSLSTSLPSASSNQHSDDSTSLSDFPVSASTCPQRSSRPNTIIITQCTSFKWQEIVLAISFTVPVGLLSTTFKAVDGTLVPDVLFTSNPALFFIFIILDAVAFTASVIGILIHALKKNKYLYCLSLLAFTALVFAFAIYLWVLLPNFLRFVPSVLLIAILLVLLYVSVSLYKQAVSSELPRQLQPQPLVAAPSS